VTNPWLVLDQRLFGRSRLWVGGIKQRMTEVVRGDWKSRPFASDNHAARSFLFAVIAGGPFELIEQTPDLVEFRGARLSPCQCVQDQFGCRPPKGPVDEIVNQLFLRLWAGNCGSIKMRATADISPYEPFFGHDLKQLQDRGVSDRTPFTNELFVNVSHRTRLTLPEHTKDF